MVNRSLLAKPGPHPAGSGGNRLMEEGESRCQQRAQKVHRRREGSLKNSSMKDKWAEMSACWDQLKVGLWDRMGSLGGSAARGP